MRITFFALLTASAMVAAVFGMPGSAQAQVIIIIGNGSTAAPPYYPRPYPYPYQPRVYAEPTLYGEPGFDAEYAENGYAATGYYQSYYNGYYRPYRYGYYRPHQYWGYRGW